MTNATVEALVTNEVLGVAILIVNFRNLRDIHTCLAALSAADIEPAFEVFVCENGGEQAFDRLRAALTGPNGPCAHDPPRDPLGRTFTTSERLVEIEHMTLRGRGSSVWTARASHNLGYAGAINALIDRLRLLSDWHAIWILNPDAEPTPNALAELMRYSAANRKGMVGSTIIADKTSNRTACRGGLHWSKFGWRTLRVGNNDRIDAPVDIGKLEAFLDCPSGASMYVTRPCIDAIGPMDERFFLYYEDLDWGMRAKPWGIGYAAASLVFHRAGSTIGSSSWRRKDRSWLSIYLENRNRIHFVRKHYPLWLPMAVAIAPRYLLPYLLVGAWADFRTALQGCLAGIRGEIGPPARLPATYFAQQIPSRKSTLRQRAKLAISACYYLLVVGQEVFRRLLGIQARCRLTIMYYHGVRSDYLFEFRRQMATLKRYGYVVSADYRGDLTRRGVALTFDDAFVSVGQNALPELSAHSFPCSIFVPVDRIGKNPNWRVEDPYDTFQETVMTHAQLTSQSELVTLGSHGMYHSYLSSIDQNSARTEIEESRRLLQQIIGRTVSSIALPYGDFNSNVIKACASAGYQNVYTTIPENIDPLIPRLARGRVRVDPSDGPIEFFLKFNGAYGWVGPFTSLLRLLKSPFEKLLTQRSHKRTGAPSKIPPQSNAKSHQDVRSKVDSV